MKSFKVGVVEDEVIIADNIVRILKNLGYEVSGPALDYASAIEMIETECPDIVLLDINLKDEKDGIDLGSVLKSKYRIPFIYLTANTEYKNIERTKLTNPSGYILKPFTNEEIYASIEICIHNFTDNNSTKYEDSYLIKDSIFIKNGNYFNKLRFEDVLYIEADHVYVLIITKESKVMVRSSFQSFLQQIDMTRFIQVHRKYAVNLNYIDSINLHNVIVGGYTIPISKNFRDDLLKKLRLT